MDMKPKTGDVLRETRQNKQEHINPKARISGSLIVKPEVPNMHTEARVIAKESGGVCSAPVFNAAQMSSKWGRLEI